jgi:hypothetical protein
MAVWALVASPVIIVELTLKYTNEDHEYEVELVLERRPAYSQLDSFTSNVKFK